MPKPVSVDAYLAGFPPAIKDRLEEMRAIIKETAPKAEETIGYSMPGYKGKTFLVYFAGYKNHVGFYPTGKGIAAFQHELEGYTYSKGAIQFPHSEPLPADLIRRIVKYRVEEDKMN